MIIPAAWPQCLDFFGTPLVIEPSPDQLSSDAGLLPVRRFDQRIGLTRSFAGALDDPRDPDLTEHTYLGLVRLGSGGPGRPFLLLLARELQKSGKMREDCEGTGTGKDAELEA
jgi:hypothetical protein